MNSSNTFNLRGTLSAVLAAAIVGTSGLAFDKGHISAAPTGIVEIGQLTPVDVLPAGGKPAGGHRQRPPPGDGRPAGEGLTMRNIFHEILARYLDTDQHAFDTDAPGAVAFGALRVPAANRARRLRARLGFHETSCGPQ